MAVGLNITMKNCNYHVKKRNIIAIVITIIIVAVTNKFWLMFRPIPVSMDIKGTGNILVTVLLNKKDNDEFKKIKSAEVWLDLDDASHAEILVPRARYPKRVKIVLDNLAKDQPITISNINIKNGKYKIDNVEKFKVEGATFKAHNNEITLIPDENGFVSLTYPDTLKIRCAIRFQLELFIITLILSYLLVYKLTDYLADFKTEKKKSRIKIIFLTIFFVLLFIPMSHMDNEEMSIQENRLLAKWKPLMMDDYEINFEFGKNFNEWFNDHFAFRQSLVNIHSNLVLLLSDRLETGSFDKRTKTLYAKGSFGHNDVDVIKDNFKALYKFNDYCNQHGIKLYVLIVPNKADIHTTKMNYVKDDYKHKDFLKYIEEVNKENRIKVVYPYKAMIQAVNQGKQLYFKTEHHWTDDGAYIGYKLLMNEIVKDYPDIYTLTDDDFEYFTNKKVRGDFVREFFNGQDCHRIGISKLLCQEYHQYDYTYYKHKQFDALKTVTINTKHRLEKNYYYSGGADYRVIQLGTSMNENLTEFIPFTFKNVKRIRNNGVQERKESEEFKIIKYYEDEILSYQPDMIIFCITYSNIPQLHDLFNLE